MCNALAELSSQLLGFPSLHEQLKLEILRWNSADLDQRVNWRNSCSKARRHHWLKTRKPHQGLAKEKQAIEKEGAARCQSWIEDYVRRAFPLRRCGIQTLRTVYLSYAVKKSQQAGCCSLPVLDPSSDLQWNQRSREQALQPPITRAQTHPMLE